jgi:hypothetical protein
MITTNYSCRINPSRTPQRERENGLNRSSRGAVALWANQASDARLRQLKSGWQYPDFCCQRKNIIDNPASETHLFGISADYRFLRPYTPIRISTISATMPSVIAEASGPL